MQVRLSLLLRTWRWRFGSRVDRTPPTLPTGAALNGTMKALLVNCTLKQGNDLSNTQALLDIVGHELKSQGAEVEHIRLVNHNILPGTASQMGPDDEWPPVLEKVKQADILILGTPIWLGQIGSIAQRFIERMDALFHEEALWDKQTGQFYPYNKVAGVVVTGSVDGAQAVSRYVLWAFSEMGYTIPPNSTCFWVGNVDEEGDFLTTGGLQSVYARKTALWLANNAVNLSRVLTANPYPTSLNQLAEQAKAAANAAKPA